MYKEKSMLKYIMNKVCSRCQISKPQEEYSGRNCICKQCYRNSAKEHYKLNRESRLEYQRKYKEENKQQIRERSHKKYECECGGSYSQEHKLKHLRTKKHIAFVEGKQPEGKQPEQKGKKYLYNCELCNWKFNTLKEHEKTKRHQQSLKQHGLNNITGITMLISVQLFKERF